MKEFKEIEKLNDEGEYRVLYEEDGQALDTFLGPVQLGAEGVILHTDVEDKYPWIPSDVKKDIQDSWTDEVIEKNEVRYNSSKRDPFDVLREERKQKFVELVDEPAKLYLNQNKTVPQSIVDVRKELCDLPTTVTPIMDEHGNLSGFDWPS